MEKVYEDVGNPFGFSDPERFQKIYKDGRNFVKNHRIYRAFRKRQLKFKRSRILTYGLGLNFQMDLATVKKYSRFNGGVKYLLVVVG